MPNVTLSRPAPFGAVSAYRVVSFFESYVESFKNWNIQRRTAKALASLSDRELEDIGLVRGDIDRMFY